jgi:hypothetical protein
MTKYDIGHQLFIINLLTLLEYIRQIDKFYMYKHQR